MHTVGELVFIRMVRDHPPAIEPSHAPASRSPFERSVLAAGSRTADMHRRSKRGSHASGVDFGSWLFVMAFWAVTVWIVIDPLRHRRVCDVSWWMIGQRAPEGYVRGSRVVAPCLTTYLAVAATISWRS